MKRFMLFTALNYYPAGGMLDFRSSHDTLEKAEDAGQLAYDQEGADDWNILDRETGETWERSARDGRAMKLELKDKG